MNALIVPVVVPLGRIDIRLGVAGGRDAVVRRGTVVGGGRVAVVSGRGRIVGGLRVAVARIRGLLRAAGDGPGERRNGDDGTDGFHCCLLVLLRHPAELPGGSQSAPNAAMLPKSCGGRLKRSSRYHVEASSELLDG